MPRVNLLIADDVGLGKTIEAGLVVQEMLLRHRARRVIVVCPASLTLKWREEMEDKFGLDFTIVDTAAAQGAPAIPRAAKPTRSPSTRARSSACSGCAPPASSACSTRSSTNDTRFPGFFDLLIVDEAHHCAPAEPPKPDGYPVDSKQTQAVRRLTEHSQHRLLPVRDPAQRLLVSRGRRCWRCSTRSASSRARSRTRPCSTRS